MDALSYTRISKQCVLLMLMSRSRPSSLLRIPYFTQISAAALIKIITPQVWRLFDGGVCLKAGLDKELYFKTTVLLFSVLN